MLAAAVGGNCFRGGPDGAACKVSWDENAQEGKVRGQQMEEALR